MSSDGASDGVLSQLEVKSRLCVPQAHGPLPQMRQDFHKLAPCDIAILEAVLTLDKASDNRQHAFRKSRTRNGVYTTLHCTTHA
jgi:hypothetical protein